MPACGKAVAACRSQIQIVHLGAAADCLANLKSQLLKSRDERMIVEMFPGHLSDLYLKITSISSLMHCDFLTGHGIFCGQHEYA